MTFTLLSPQRSSFHSSWCGIPLTDSHTRRLQVFLALMGTCSPTVCQLSWSPLLVREIMNQEWLHRVWLHQGSLLLMGYMYMWNVWCKVCAYMPCLRLEAGCMCCAWWDTHVVCGHIWYVAWVYVVVCMLHVSFAGISVLFSCSCIWLCPGCHVSSRRHLPHCSHESVEEKPLLHPPHFLAIRPWSIHQVYEHPHTSPVQRPRT